MRHTLNYINHIIHENKTCQEVQYIHHAQQHVTSVTHKKHQI